MPNLNDSKEIEAFFDKPGTFSMRLLIALYFPRFSGDG